MLQKKRPSGRRGLALAVTLAVCASTACSDAILPELTTWEGQLAPLTPADRTSGSVGALASGGRTETSIQILGGQPGRSYGWRIATGSCASLGDVVGGSAVYPVLTPGEDGMATGETILSRQLAADATHAAWLYLQGPGGTETPVACGALVRKR